MSFNYQHVRSLILSIVRIYTRCKLIENMKQCEGVWNFLYQMFTFFFLSSESNESVKLTSLPKTYEIRGSEGSGMELFLPTIDDRFTHSDDRKKLNSVEVLFAILPQR